MRLHFRLQTVRVKRHLRSELLRHQFIGRDRSCRSRVVTGDIVTHRQGGGVTGSLGRFVLGLCMRLVPRDQGLLRREARTSRPTRVSGEESVGDRAQRARPCSLGKAL